MLYSGAIKVGLPLVHSNPSATLTDPTPGIVAGLLVNPTFIARFLAGHGGADVTSDHVDSFVNGIPVVCLQVSAAVGSLIAGRARDIVGRKKCLHGLAFVMGRTLQGVGVGFFSKTVPVIQAEIAAPHRRGLMVGIENTFLIGGYALPTWVEHGFYYLIPNNTSWQGPYFIQMGLAFVFFSMSFILPETPRWLARNGFTAGYAQTVAHLHPPDVNTEAQHIKQVVLEIMEAVRYVATLGESTWRAMFTRYRKRTLVGITAQMFAQINDINVISSYLPTTLAAAGFSDYKSLLDIAANSIPCVAATILT
ncbi:hypothetical protein PFICI_11929 [Pestalotiopsis fici W106-1]|uniref:Major facilitator superfamily (MFS) profile domain-containing protein n=1 Tax=Pestalotiopsis fici (strain W106-1 / CGMCC3.15140) TaxID=1229662 RepID=W3WTP3_PESFW|nr:uncharacterized protein PFICI_11929 [Pestalotiopsis fici W106-1]ETS76542.1 hypothetical protein PFICI_11929 [Pestalotiopsis fici W106-1]